MCLTGVPVHERAEDLLGRSDIDAVVICAPTQFHAELAVAAADAGKHFYLEKPIATDAAGARRVVDAAAAAGVIGAIGFNRRLHPLYQQARDLLAAGRIGRVRAVQTALCEPLPAETMPGWRRQRASGARSAWTATCRCSRSDFRGASATASGMRGSRRRRP
jgi:predicted dehydrogenase